MNRICPIMVTAAVLSVAGSGCMSRAIKEGAGVVLGASGKVVYLQKPGKLGEYRGLAVEPITVAAGLTAPHKMPALIQAAYVDAARELRLTSTGSPKLSVRGEIIHYESGGIIDTAIGPLQEVIVRTQLYDADSGKILGEANLIGRAKTITASGAENLAEGTGKALKEWLEDHGLEEE